MPPTFTYSLQGSPPNQYLRLVSVDGTFEPNYDLVLDTDIWPGDGLSYPVKEITNSSIFQLNNSAQLNLRSIVMNNLTTISGINTFANCVSLNSVSFPNLSSFTGGQTFIGCSSLTDFTQVNLGTTINTLPTSAFLGCNFTNITLPSNITTLFSQVFQANTRLQSFYAPQLTSIGSNLFASCTSITDITKINIGTTITTLPNFIFNGCRFVNVTLPSHIKALGSGVFYNNSMLQYFYGPQLTSVDLQAFQDCKVLHTCVLGPIPVFKFNVFNGCTALNSLYISTLTSPTVNNNAFFGTSALQYIFIRQDADWTGFTAKTPVKVDIPTTSTPTFTTTLYSVQLNTSGSTTGMPSDYIIPYYTYIWTKDGIIQSSSSSQLSINNSIDTVYTVQSIDPLLQESSAVSTNIPKIISGVNYVYI